MKAGYVATTSYNGIAAVNIDGSTLCTLLNIQVCSRKTMKMEAGIIDPIANPNDLHRLRHALNSKELCLFIVDEVSTIDAAMVCAIDTRLKAIMGCDDDFGGVAIIFLGDFNQLPAVGCDSLPLSLMQVAHLLHGNAAVDDEIKVKQKQSKTHGSSSRAISTTVEAPPKTKVRMPSRSHSRRVASQPPGGFTNPSMSQGIDSSEFMRPIDTSDLLKVHQEFNTLGTDGATIVGSFQVTKNSLQTLIPAEWLGDQVLHFAYKFLQLRDSKLCQQNP
jgi:hypothetical protein